MAMESKADVLGYGGAAGGGKSEMLLGLALLRHRRSAIFRREATNLGALLDRIVEIVGTSNNLNRNTGMLRLAGNRQVEFLGCKDPGDEQKQRGRPRDFLGFDEADQFDEFQIRFIMGWLRTTTPNQRCRAVLTFNPPSTVEGRWLIEYFGPWLNDKHPRPVAPGELRWYAMIRHGKDFVETERPNGDIFTHEGETIKPKSRTFIPARVTDNRFLFDTGYIATLQAMPEPLRSQLLYGDFKAGVTDGAWQLIPTAHVEAAMERWSPDGYGLDAIDAVGTDIARGGADSTTICRRRRHWFAPILDRKSVV